MAAITARSAKKRVSYHDLHNLSTADLLFDEKKKKRRLASTSFGFFEAELFFCPLQFRKSLLR